MNEEFREDVRQVVHKHSMDLSPDDLREMASRLEQEADRREDSAL